MFKPKSNQEVAKRKDTLADQKHEEKQWRSARGAVCGLTIKWSYITVEYKVHKSQENAICRLWSSALTLDDKVALTTITHHRCHQTKRTRKKKSTGILQSSANSKAEYFLKIFKRSPKALVLLTYKSIDVCVQTTRKRF